MTIVLADAAPTGAGLAIVGVILLAFLGISIAVLVLIVRFVVRRVRANRQPS